MKSILLITTSSLAANPRLVKEFEALKKEYNCHVLCFKHHDWSLELSDAIKSRNPEVKFIEIDRKKEVYQTIVSKLAHKLAILLNGQAYNNFKIYAFANNDKALQLCIKAMHLQNRSNYSRVIAHNLGSFYAAVTLSIQNDISLQLDIEDFYPGEALYFNIDHEQQNRMQLMAQSFLKADSITYASKGIRLECEKHFKVDSETEQVTIINAFKAEDFEKPEYNTTETLKCVWFSQHIGPNRGLEQVFEVAKKLDHIEFYLVGYKDRDYLNNYDLSSNVRFCDIMNENNLHHFLRGMDVGLALENVDADQNRNICLTNKLLAYAQAGLYILATDTFGQADFLNSLNYNAGQIIEDTLEGALQNLNGDLLGSAAKIKRWQNAKSFSWEKEQIKLMNLIS